MSNEPDPDRNPDGDERSREEPRRRHAVRAEGAERSRGSTRAAMSARAKSPAAATRPAPKARSGAAGPTRAKRAVETRIRPGGISQPAAKTAGQVGRDDYVWAMSPQPSTSDGLRGAGPM